MNLSLVLIIYRSKSPSAKEASLFCIKALKDRNIKSKSIESDFDNNQLEKYFCNLAKLPDLVMYNVAGLASAPSGRIVLTIIRSYYIQSPLII